uniref:Uncharacterized protein n=1 Tax=Arundo donax TaxID=35708 RepID=A0A0A8YE33_ARUDO
MYVKRCRLYAILSSQYNCADCPHKNYSKLLDSHVLQDS